MKRTFVIKKVDEGNMDMYYIYEPEIDMIWRSWDPWSFNKAKLKKAMRQMEECYRGNVEWINTVEGLRV